MCGRNDAGIDHIEGCCRVGTISRLCYLSIFIAFIICCCGNSSDRRRSLGEIQVTYRVFYTRDPGCTEFIVPIKYGIEYPPEHEQTIRVPWERTFTYNADGVSESAWLSYDGNYGGGDPAYTLYTYEMDVVTQDGAVSGSADGLYDGYVVRISMIMNRTPTVSSP